MKTTIILIILLSTFKAFSQDSLKFEANIVVLYPFKTDAKNINDDLLEGFRLTKDEKINNKPDTINTKQENRNLIAIKQNEFINNIDYYGEYSLRLTKYLTYNLFDHFNEMVAYPKYQKLSSVLKSMNKFATKEGTNWVINIKSVSISKLDDKFSGNASVCVYNLLQDTIVFDKSYSLTDINHGSMFACKDNTINCVINDFIYQAGDEILTAMLSDKKYWIK